MDNTEEKRTPLWKITATKAEASIIRKGAGSMPVATWLREVALQAAQKQKEAQ